MHDVLWPYGRRDLYYAPGRDPRGVPPAVRDEGHPARARKQLLPSGGLNPEHYNAVTEGGPRNGVMTALDDFMAEYDRPLRRLVLPVYFGLAIVVEEARLEREPELRALLDSFECGRGQGHPAGDRRGDRASRRSCSSTTTTTAAASAHRAPPTATSTCSRPRCSTSCTSITSCGSGISPTASSRGTAAEPAKLGDPVREMQLKWEKLVEERRAGALPHAGHAAPRFPIPTWARAGSSTCGARSTPCATENIAGDLVECGTGRGGAAIFMRGYLDAHEIGRRGGLDRRPLPRRSRVAVGAPRIAWSDLNTVRDGFARFGLLDDRVRFLQGPPGDTLADAPIKQIALLRIGPGDAADVAAAFDALYHRVAIGGVVIVDDYERRTAPGGRRVPRAAARRRADRARRRFRRRVAQDGARPARLPRRIRAAPATEAAPEESKARGLLAPRTAPRSPRPPTRVEGPLGRRRLLQHEARSRAHAALALARLPTGDRRSRLRGHRGRERLGRRSEARRRVRAQLRRRVPLPRPRRRRRPRHPPTR